MEEVIRVENLRKEFLTRKRKAGMLGSLRSLLGGGKERLVAVDGLNFTIRRGELVGYLGPNGAGKSTTIKMLTGILQPTSGSIRVDGADPTRERRSLTRRIGVVFGQKTQLWWDLPVEESFDLLRTIYRIPRSDYARRMDFFRGLLGLDEFLSRPVRQLSLGQRMRADLAASLLHNPPVLFLDEPTIGLDILTRDAMREFIKKLNQQEQTTIVLTTHDMQDIEFLATRLILIDKGRLQYDGKIEEFTNRYSTEKLVTVHLEDGLAGLELLRGLEFQIQAGDSPHRFFVRMEANASLGPLIQAVSDRGGRIQELNVSRPDLADTLKSLYGGKQLEL